MSSSGSCLVKKHHHTRNQSRPLNFNLCSCLPCLSAVYPPHNHCLWAFVLHEQMWIFSRNLPQTSSLYSFLKLSVFFTCEIWSMARPSGKLFCSESTQPEVCNAWSLLVTFQLDLASDALMARAARCWSSSVMLSVEVVSTLPAVCAGSRHQTPSKL